MKLIFTTIIIKLFKCAIIKKTDFGSRGIGIRTKHMME